MDPSFEEHRQSNGEPLDASVVVPTRNRRVHLERVVKAVLGQEDVRLELIVVDEASDDGTWEYLMSLDDPRVRPIRHARPQGVSTARNTGLANASAPMVAFVDDDDLWAPTKLRRQLRQVENTPGARWSCTGAAVVDERLVVHRLHAPPEADGLADVLLTHNCIPGGGSGVLVRADLVRAVGGFDETLSNLADWDLWIRLALASPLASVADPLTGSVIHGSTASHDVKASAEELAQMRTKYRDECRARGVVLGGWASGRYEAESYLRAGRRFSAAAVELRYGARHGRTRSLPWAAMAVLSPLSLTRRDRNKVERTADPALRIANAWLEQYRMPHGQPVTGVLQRR